VVWNHRFTWLIPPVARTDENNAVCNPQLQVFAIDAARQVLLGKYGERSNGWRRTAPRRHINERDCHDHQQNHGRHADGRREPARGFGLLNHHPRHGVFVDYHSFHWGSKCLNRSRKAIAVLGKGFDVPAVLVPENLAKHGDVAGKTALLDERVRPNTPYQIFLL
jgi:hypothetical protein